MRSPLALAAAALALLVPLLSGCVGSDSAATLAPARLACPDDICNLLATVDPVERQANELSIAVNPTNPDNLIATGKDYTPNEAGDCVWAGIYTTLDGGRTWTNANVPGSNWRLLSDPTTYEPHPLLSEYWCATDPVVAFGPDGTAYWSVMPYQCDRLSGSATGRGVAPDGGFNDWLWTCSSMYVLVSDDGGLTWPTVRAVAVGPRLEHDKQWLTVAPDGRVLLCWDRDPSYQLTGLADNPVGANPAAQLAPNGFIACAVSADKGRTWSQPVNINQDPSDPTGQGTTWLGFLPWVDFDGAGEAWMAAIDGTNVIVTHSPDGLAWADPVLVGNYTDPPAGGEYGWPVLAGSDFRIFALPTLAVDRTTGPNRGNIYVAWFDHSEGRGRILFTASQDGGATWSPQTQIRDDGPNPLHDQFMPALSAGPDGTLDLTWYDRRDDPANHLFDLYYAYSLDGGKTWSENLRVSQTSSDEQFSHHQNGMVFLGDYGDLDSSQGRAHAVWIGTAAQQADVYVAHIERPSANDLS